MDATIRIADVLALAGGFTANANPNKIQPVREGVVLNVELAPQMIIEASPVRSRDQILAGEKS